MQPVGLQFWLGFCLAGSTLFVGRSGLSGFYSPLWSPKSPVHNLVKGQGSVVVSEAVGLLHEHCDFSG